jgi:hypothetical protein
MEYTGSRIRSRPGHSLKYAPQSLVSTPGAGLPSNDIPSTICGAITYSGAISATLRWPARTRCVIAQVSMVDTTVQCIQPFHGEDYRMIRFEKRPRKLNAILGSSSTP